MIPYSTLKTQLRARLDDEGTTRYDDVLDLIPAINAAIGRTIAAANYALAQRKGSEKMLSELLQTRMFQTNALGGLYLDPYELGHGVWEINALYAQPDTFQSNPQILSGDAARSRYRSDLTFAGSSHPVRRQTIEQIALARNNKSMQGNEAMADTEWASYAYAIIGQRSTTSTPTTPTTPWFSRGWELIVTPKSKTARALVAVSYLKDPDPVVDDQSLIEFPLSMTNILVAWADQYLAWKQGDGTTLYGVADKDAAQLFGAQS